MALRDRPRPLGPCRIAPCTFVAMTVSSRRVKSARARPMISSLEPLEYTLAVSKKLMPASTAWRISGRLWSSGSVQGCGPRPGSPYVMHPSATGEMSMPVLPSLMYSMFVLRQTVPGPAAALAPTLCEERPTVCTQGVPADPTVAASQPDARCRRVWRPSPVGAETLVSQVKLCMAQIQGLQLVQPERIIKEHQRLLELIEAGDGEAASSFLDLHLFLRLKRISSSAGRRAYRKAKAGQP